LPLRQIIGRNGRFQNIRFGEGAFKSKDSENANMAYSALAGLTVNQARSKILDLLKTELVSEPRPVEQAVKFLEKGDFPLEFISTRQWFVRILEHKNEFLEQGRKIEWHPEFMLRRYEQWVEGLNQDWCISRQRFFGVPFPVWYPIGESGEVDFEHPILATEDRLPIDPLTDSPTGFAEAMRGKPGGFIGDPDVMDTWATSSMTPQINSGGGSNLERHKSLFPADLRPQAHEIIRTWAFYTIVKSWMHEQAIPWKEIAISGWVVDPNRNKMSKSKGNVITPESLIETYSADALRYWAGRAKLGQDTIYDEKMFQTGRRLITKLFNASKFVMLQCASTQCECTADTGLIIDAVDKAWATKMQGLISSTTKHFRDLDYAQALIELEKCFWEFCDVYVELVKTRAYQKRETSSGRSAVASLDWSLKTFLRLFAPFLPYISEEVWSWRYSGAPSRSIHLSAWPSTDEIKGDTASAEVYELAAHVLLEIRSTKAAARRNLKWKVDELTIRAPENQESLLKLATGDLCDSGVVEKMSFTRAEGLEIEVSLSSD
jgi:valyl-tRNA synthetase